MKKFSLGLIYILIFSTTVFGDINPRVTKGILDLRNWNWQKNGIANLTGSWEFYWQKFYGPVFFNDSFSNKKSYAFVPSFWNRYIPQQENIYSGFGYATYHLLVLCSASNKQLALKFLTVESAYRLFVNGKEILDVGHPDTSAETTIAELKPAIINVA